MTPPTHIRAFTSVSADQDALAAYAYRFAASIAHEIVGDCFKSGDDDRAIAAAHMADLYDTAAIYLTQTAAAATSDHDAHQYLESIAQQAHEARNRPQILEALENKPPPDTAEHRRFADHTAATAANLRWHIVTHMGNLHDHREHFNFPESLATDLSRNTTRIAAYFAQDDQFDDAAGYNQLTPDIPHRDTLDEITLRIQDLIDLHPNELVLNVSPAIRTQPRIVSTLATRPYHIAECFTAVFNQFQNPAGIRDEISIHFCFRGQRYLQSITEPFPAGYPALDARNITRVAATTLTHSERNYPNYRYSRHWRMIHAVNAAIDVGLHTATDLDIQHIVQSLDNHRPPVPNGLKDRLITAIALGNRHAADFIARGHADPSKTRPTSTQIQQLVDAARAAGIDEHHIHTFVLALSADPDEFNVATHPADLSFLHNLVEPCDSGNIPLTNLWIAAKTLSEIPHEQ